MRVECGWVCEQFGARRGMDDGAAIENDRLVGERQDLLGLLFDDDHREARAAKFAQRRQQFVDDDRRESLGRLIEQQEARVEEPARGRWPSTCCSPPAIAGP